MVKLSQFLIEFDSNPAAVYFAGQQITGNVQVALNEGMKMRGIKIRFEGKARTHWTEHHSHGTGQNRHSETVHYHGEEVYVDTGDVGIWGFGGGDQVLAAGSYRFPFQFFLPPNCPTSFEGVHGSIRYTVKSVIDKPWKFDHSVKRAFTVIGLQVRGTV